MNNYNTSFPEIPEFLQIFNDRPLEIKVPVLQQAVISRGVTFPQSKIEYKWNVNDSKILIDLYGTYHKKVGTFEIKNNKMLWQKIAEELRKQNIIVSADNCLNRWRVLERNYKKLIDNNKKTGRGKKYFEYEIEMGQVVGHKKNLHPEILLSTDTQHTLPDPDSAVDNRELGNIPYTSTPCKNTATSSRKRKAVKKRSQRWKT